MSKLQLFLERHSIRKYKKGDVILQQETEPPCALIVKKGIIKTYDITSTGEEKPIGFNIKGQLFPLGWIFGKIRRTQYYYEALSDSQLYFVPREELTSYLYNNPDIMSNILDSCVSESINHQMRIHALEQSKASDKILHTIHYLALCFGRDLKRDIVEISLPLTQQDVANFTGLTRETTSMELKKLTKRRVLFRKSRNYIVLTDKLNELLDDEYEHHLVR